MSMLSAGDIKFIRDSVGEVIDSWDTTITLLQPKDTDDQIGYDPILHEFVGNVEYDCITVDAERKDIVNNNTNDLSPNSMEYGENDDGKYLYAIKDTITIYEDGKECTKKFKPSNNAIVIIDDSDDRYKIVSMRDRIGEIILQIQRITGSIPDGSEHINDENIPHDGTRS